jgi:hypothetical protein
MVRCEPPVGRRGGLTNDSGTDYPVQYQKAALAKCHPQDPQDPQTKNPQKRPIYQYNQFVTPKSGVIHCAAAQRHLNGFIREQRANANFDTAKIDRRRLLTNARRWRRCFDFRRGERCARARVSFRLTGRCRHRDEWGTGRD